MYLWYCQSICLSRMGYRPAVSEPAYNEEATEDTGLSGEGVAEESFSIPWKLL